MKHLNISLLAFALGMALGLHANPLPEPNMYVQISELAYDSLGNPVVELVCISFECANQSPENLGVHEQYWLVMGEDSLALPLVSQWPWSELKLIRLDTLGWENIENNPLYVTRDNANNHSLPEHYLMGPFSELTAGEAWVWIEEEGSQIRAAYSTLGLPNTQRKYMAGYLLREVQDCDTCAVDTLTNQGYDLSCRNVSPGGWPHYACSGNIYSGSNGQFMTASSLNFGMVHHLLKCDNATGRCSMYPIVPQEIFPESIRLGDTLYSDIRLLVDGDTQGVAALPVAIETPLQFRGNSREYTLVLPQAFPLRAMPPQFMVFDAKGSLVHSAIVKQHRVQQAFASPLAPGNYSWLIKAGGRVLWSGSF